MESVIFNEDLTIIGLDRREKEDVLKEMSIKLEERGYVTDDFLSHVLKREEEYPTGLLATVPLALCHTEAKFVKKSSLVVSTLKNPVEFHEMGNPDGLVMAQIVFLLALHNPKDQVMWLKRMANLFKNEEALVKIKNASYPKDVVIVLQGCLFDGIGEDK